MSIINIADEKQFEEEVLKAPGNVLVDFYADWCGPCKLVAPILEEIAAENPAPVAKVNVDSLPSIAQRYGVMSIPTIIVFQEGQEKKKMVGAHSKQEILDILV